MRTDIFHGVVFPDYAIGPDPSLPILTELGMHFTQVAPTGCDLVRGNFEGLAMWA
jgi:hypothetical protein